MAVRPAEPVADSFSFEIFEEKIELLYIAPNCHTNIQIKISGAFPTYLALEIQLSNNFYELSFKFWK